MRERALGDALRIFLDTETSPSVWSYRLTGRTGRSKKGVISSLDELAAVLRHHGALLADLPWTELPTFGGPAPLHTSGVWSWDERRLLVGAEPSSLQLIPRDSPDVAWTRSPT
ncbi:hypothetical protein [Hyalangium versicolor]|uniref:hypothetical protein n=1 Tax=Hyalangium versicolor TaxID=2861190 RepID=UPI001CC9DFAF|nr:hypothetical protein [Hyalangium versicolor]